MRIEIKRRMSPDDITDVSGLLAAAERADDHQPLADHQWLELREGGRAGFAGLVGWIDGHHHPVAYTQVSRGNESWGLELVIDPHHRYEAATIGPAIVKAALEIIQAEGGGHVHWWVFEPTSVHQQIATDVGLVAGRELLQMRVPLPLDIHSSIGVRSFRAGHDEPAWLVVNNRAFADHPEQGGWDLATITAREREPWFDPAGFLLHERDGRLAGFCWTKLHLNHNPALGEIYVVAVDPDFHGLGLGRALTIAGLEKLGARGMTVGMLYVDASNAAAVGLYRSLGFTVHHVDRAFVGNIAG